MKAFRLASNRVLIIDDEPEYLGWVVEYLKSLALKPEFAISLGEGLTRLEPEKYRLVLLDMNIPGEVAQYIEVDSEPILTKYRGLVVANRARTMGYGAHQVIAYTVHDDEAIQAELDKLNCRYVLKGRPEVFKGVIRSSLELPLSRRKADSSTSQRDVSHHRPGRKR